ncbi:hypothetical protein [Sorangium sp. So ce341]|uniref:hypothetical protein n=1 Tax=Sorangium sp. So ce341 TaxID=3133302 RepID=UPI003F61D3E1
MRKVVTLDELDDFLVSATRGTITAEAAVAWGHDHEPAPADPWLLPDSEADAVFLAAFQRMIRTCSEPDYIGEASRVCDYRRALLIEGSPLAVWEYDHYQIALRVCARAERYAEVIASVHHP